MKNDDFIQATGYLRVLEKKVLDSNGIKRVMDAPSAMDTLRLLAQNSDYDFNVVQNPQDYENVLKSELKKIYDMAYGLSKHPVIVDIPGAKYDFHNMKVALKAHYVNKNMDYLYSDITSINYQDMVQFVQTAENPNKLPDYITEALAQAKATYETTKNPEDIDIVLDKKMYAYILNLCEEINNSFITDYVMASIDFYNVKTFLRVKNMQKGLGFLNTCLIDGGKVDKSFYLQHYDKNQSALSSVFYYKYFGDIIQKGMESFDKTGNYSDVEKLFDNYLINHIKQAKYIAFGPEVLFAYIISKENEMKQIRILVTCKLNDIHVEAIQERLRDNYA